MTVFLTRQARLECPAAPAPGHRGRGEGALWGVGVNGHSWSSTQSGTSAHDLNFYYGGVSPQGNSYRGYGFPLRCLQE